jgi:glycosyltransferase involved in cell wall biosynthesis
VIYHICDHGNAHYRRALPVRGVLATCHDLLALRSERNELPYQPSRGPLAAWRQCRMFTELKKIPWLACDSQATRVDFLRLAQRQEDPRVRVIPLTLNQAYRPMPLKERVLLLAPWANLQERPYLLHVGGNEPRKNKMLLPKALVCAVRSGWNGLLVLAGAPPPPAWWDETRAQGVFDRVIVIEHPSAEILNALYSGAHALVFPSFAEGFGWPILEAHATGCPVLCSNTTSLPEVAGDAALLFAPTDVIGFSNAVVQLANDATLRSELIRKGFNQVARFSEDAMFAGYASLYRTMLADA